VRRIVATLLVVASPVLMAVPADAGEGPVAVPTVVPVAPTPVPTGIPAGPDTLAPAVPAPVAMAPAVPTPAKAPAAVRPVVRTVRAKAPAAAVDDAAYSAQLQADLCEARTIFCGLDRNGHYPAG